MEGVGAYAPADIYLEGVDEDALTYVFVYLLRSHARVAAVVGILMSLRHNDINELSA
jgi:hypothetical protein